MYSGNAKRPNARRLASLTDRGISMRHWYAVHSKPRQESAALTHLLRQSYDAYLPLWVERRRTRSGYQNVMAPLFPGYLFVQLDLGADNAAPIRSTVGCIGLVRFGRRILALPPGLIESLKMREQGGAIGMEPPGWTPGQRIHVAEGPFAGLDAIFCARSGMERVIVLLEWLGAQRPVEIPERALMAADAA